MTTRRRFLQAGLLTATAAAFPGSMLFSQTPKKKGMITLAVQTWTFRLFDLDEGIRKTREAGIDQVEISGGVLLAGKSKRAAAMTADEKNWLRDILTENKVRAVSLGGSQGTPEDFDFAREMGLDFLQGEPPYEKLIEVSRRAEEFGVRFSLHNHPKESQYWDYRESLKRIKDCSPALGFCPDTGHFMRSGFDPLQVIREFSGRIVSVHMKDLNDTNPDAKSDVKLHDVPWGTGAGQVEAILDELKEQGFTGPVIVEYEYDWENNLADVKKCAEFFQKVAGEQT